MTTAGPIQTDFVVVSPPRPAEGPAPPPLPKAVKWAASDSDSDSDSENGEQRTCNSCFCQ